MLIFKYFMKFQFVFLYSILKIYGVYFIFRIYKNKNTQYSVFFKLLLIIIIIMFKSFQNELSNFLKLSKYKLKF